MCKNEIDISVLVFPQDHPGGGDSQPNPAQGKAWEGLRERILDCTDSKDSWADGFLADSPRLTDALD